MTTATWWLSLSPTIYEAIDCTIAQMRLNILNYVYEKLILPSYRHNVNIHNPSPASRLATWPCFDLIRHISTLWIQSTLLRSTSLKIIRLRSPSDFWFSISWTWAAVRQPSAMMYSSRPFLVSSIVTKRANWTYVRCTIPQSKRSSGHMYPHSSVYTTEIADNWLVEFYPLDWVR
jgi:hypothetical protein